MYEVFVDGGARGNPGPAAYGFVVLMADSIIAKESGYLGVRTNNQAEYLGVTEALEWIVQNLNIEQNEQVNFFLDSQLIVKQMSGEFRIKDSILKDFYTKIKNLADHNKLNIKFHLIPREKNKVADKLVNMKLDEKM